MLICHKDIANYIDNNYRKKKWMDGVVCLVDLSILIYITTFPRCMRLFLLLLRKTRRFGISLRGRK